MTQDTKSSWFSDLVNGYVAIETSKNYNNSQKNKAPVTDLPPTQKQVQTTTTKGFFDSSTNVAMVVGGGALLALVLLKD